MALKRLQACAPAISWSLPNADSFWLFVLKKLSNKAARRTENERRYISLKRITFDSPFMVHDEPPCVLNELSKSISFILLLLASALYL